MRAGHMDEMPVTWFGLVCDDGPVLNVGLGRSAGLMALKPGEPFRFTLGRVELVGEVAECAELFGRALLRLRLVQAAVEGRRLASAQLHDFCCRDGWRRWLAGHQDPIHPS
ncbi:MAG: hypothetical protein D6751_06550 [Deltaproteobacteria bacterium]|nr:MAG: hypothetical protein D6751_06550 [Deltaproteobacteria bacterium]